MMKTGAIILIAVLFLIALFHPGRHAKYYDYIPIAEASSEFVASKTQKPNLTICPLKFYVDLIQTGVEFTTQDVFIKHNYTQPLLGGEHRPEDCAPRFKIALIVPYRNRTQQLQLFLGYMHAFLQRQKLHYRIFIADQGDNGPFNRAKMLNTGASEALKTDFPCLILHDVDLFPLTLGNVYACTKRPRHMSSSIDTFRFNLPYLGLFGGAIAIRSEQFQRVNGMSNVFDGWGGEDDDFFSRLELYQLLPYRFAPELSRYTMLFHKKEKASNDRWKKLEQSLRRRKVDGLNSLPKYKVVLEPLYTHVITV